MARSPFSQTAAHPFFTRPTAFRADAVGTEPRWFRGRQTHVGERCSRLHIPRPEDIAARSSDLLFAEPPKIAAPRRRLERPEPGPYRPTRRDVLNSVTPNGSRWSAGPGPWQA